MVGDTVGEAEPGTPIHLVQCSGGTRKSALTEILQFLGSQVEYGTLIVRFRGWIIQRVTNAGVDIEPTRSLPFVLNKVLLDVSPRTYGLFLDRSEERRVGKGGGSGRRKSTV